MNARRFLYELVLSFLRRILWYMRMELGAQKGPLRLSLNWIHGWNEAKWDPSENSSNDDLACLVNPPSSITTRTGWRDGLARALRPSSSELTSHPLSQETPEHAN